MTVFSRLATTTLLATLLATTSCATAPERRPQSVSEPVSEPAGGGIGGTLGGYILGDVVGGRRERTAKIARAGIGGIPGAGIGAYMDAQEADMRARTLGTDVRVTRQGDDLILTIPSELTFAYKSDSVAPGFQRTLDQLAAVLQTHERSFVDVYGHTDSTGSDGYNQALSERRARAVAAYLMGHGVNAARLATKGFGRTQPIAANETPEGQAANRRVEIKIVPIADSDLR
ncbi:OmpA family protein [Sphingomonas sp. RB3P16]|uniref:OmpA family protein n=1 Tax=Parasphingomonas frigoris TaxID=3096163 RepID=UPI002FC7A5E4